MRNILFAYEPYIRLCAFAGVFIAMAVWEFIRPRRKQAIGRGWRWPNNLGIVIVDTLLVRILFPTTAVGLAMFAEARERADERYETALSAEWQAAGEWTPERDFS